MYKRQVQKGALLTTDQVFALMKGDVHEAQNRVADPFADYNKIRQPEVKPKATNTKEIASWDEGGAYSAPTSEQTESKSTNTPQKPVVKKSDSKPNAWKDWDEN